MTSQVRAWSATWALHRAGSLAVAGGLAAVLLGRADVAVLTAPFVLVLLWSVAVRPRTPVTFGSRLGRRSLAEGRATTWRASAHGDGIAEVAALLADVDDVARSPDRGALVAERDPAVAVTVGRWGRHRIGTGVIGAHSEWGSFRAVSNPIEVGHVTALPIPANFDAVGDLPNPDGLVGASRSPRIGGGTQLATIRPFQAGDRLRHIHWPVTTKTGHLHVTAHHAEEDAALLILVDATVDVGPRHSREGSSLDRSVRGAGAVAAHYLRRGDRVALRVVTASDVVDVGAGTGRGHSLRLLHTLAGVSVETEVTSDVIRVRPRVTVPAGTLVVVFTPLLTPWMTARIVSLQPRGDVVVLDTAPDGVRTAEKVEDWMSVDDRGETSDAVTAAWRVRRLERSDEVDALRARGIPVVPWRGPGTLDDVLVRLRQARRSPRAVGR